MAVAANAQTTTITCANWVINGVHTCNLLNQIVADNENQIFFIQGVQPGFRAIEVQPSSSIPFIISTLFEVIPNAFRVIIHPSADLNRIQTNAFRNASNLELLIIGGNPLRTIQNNAFLGASSLITLDLRNNQINSISEDAFRGLVSLENFMLENNQLRRLPGNLFWPLINLETVFLSDNQVEVLDGRIFGNNAKLRQVDFTRNRISEIGRRVLDGLNDLEVVGLFGNRCANNFWTVDETHTTEDIRVGLNECFVNFDATKRFRAEVRGTATISDDYGNELFKL